MSTKRENKREIPVSRLVIASNRLPVALARDEDGAWAAKPGSGGLVTALAPVLRDRGGTWIGWTGTTREDDVDVGVLAHATADVGYDLAPVVLSAADRDGYYYGFTNATLWPLFHDLQTAASYVPADWQAYLRVNHAFADEVAKHADDDAFVWIQDYHLFHVARGLRHRGVRSRLGFFLHIPFPPLDIFARLPWRAEILRALLAHDLVGFQTPRDRRNFLGCVRHLLPEAKVGRRDQRLVHVTHEGRAVAVGAFPIGIDFGEFADHARSKEVAEEAWIIHEALPDRKIVLGVDRLDYTKGILERLEAFRLFLERHPEWLGHVQLVQIVVPSRTDVPGYADLKLAIEQRVGEINGAFTAQGWVPVHYIFRSLNRTELLGYYRTSEVALVTPLKDGMNLVAKEYCAASVEERGVLILSEFAGAAAQLARGALLVNPHDVEGMADALQDALTMPEDEQARRMHAMREVVRRESVFAWVDTFLRAANAPREPAPSP